MDWRALPSLSALRGFEAAARLQSLSAAARELNVTHAAVAQHVRTLEDHFSTALLRREGRRMVTTDDGWRLAQALGDGFGTIAEAVRELNDRNVARPLRVSMTPSFAANWLMPRIGSFWVQHPEIRLELVPDHALVDLRRGGFDLAIRYGRGGWSGVDTEPLVSARHAIVAAPRLLSRLGDRTIEALQTQHWILEAGRTEERVWAAGLGLDLDAARVTEVDTNDLVIQAVLAGHGMSILPKAIAASEVDQGRLEILVAEAESQLAYHMLTRPGRVSPDLRTFMRWLKGAV